MPQTNDTSNLPGSDFSGFPPPGEPLNLKQMMEQAARLDGRRQDIAAVITERVQHILMHGLASAHFYGPMDTLLLKSLDCKVGMAVGDVFLPGGDVYESVAMVAGRENAALLRRMWERKDDYPLLVRASPDDDPNPRFRSKRLGCLYVGNAIEMLYGYRVMVTGAAGY